MLWQASVAAVLVALVVAPLVPVTDLLRRNPGSGDGVGSSTGFELTTVNPFVRLRRDLVEKTHTPMVYADTTRTRDGLPPHHRPRPVPRRRVAALAPRPAERQHRRRSLPQPPGLAGGVAGTTDDWKLRLAPEFGTTWLPLPYPILDLQVQGRWRFDSRTLDVAYVGGSLPDELSYRGDVVHPQHHGEPPQLDHAGRRRAYGAR